MAEELVDWASDSFGDTEPITVTLEGEGTVDFQTAFGEYSEARGRGRRRRQKRRMERIKRRQERRALRRQGRMTAMRERQAIRAERKAAKVARKQIGEEEEPVEEMPESAAERPISDEYVAEETYAPPADDSSGEYDSAAEEEAVYDEYGPSDEGAEYTGDYGVDGKRSPSENDAKWDDFYAAEGLAKVNPKVVEITRRLEKNKELAKNIEGRIFGLNERAAKKGAPLGNSGQALMAELNARLEKVRGRIALLEQKLAKYTAANADLSSAEGVNMDDIARKRAELRAAKKAAREERRAFIRGKRKARIAELFAQKKGTMPARQAMQEARAQARMENPFKVTQVEGGLEAQFSPQRIEVPAQDGTASSFNGTGLIGLDAYEDYDAPPVRNVELDFSNATGKMKIDWKSIAIGVGITVIGLVVYNRFIKKR
jgi:hypothetical protein